MEGNTNYYDQSVWTDDIFENINERIERETGIHISSPQEILEAPPLKYLVENFLVDGFLYVLSALAGTGKSLFTLELAKSIVTGEPFLRKFDVSKPGGVLIVDNENPISLLQDRFKLMKIPQTVEVLHFQPIRLDEEKSFGNLMRVIELKNPSMVIIDTVMRLHMQKNDEDGMKIISQKLRQITLAGPTVIGLYHSPKKQTATNLTRGSGEIVAACDTEYFLSKTGSTIEIKNGKTRVGDIAPFKFKIVKTDTQLWIELADKGGREFNPDMKVLKEALGKYIESKGPPNQGQFLEIVKNIYPSMGKEKIFQHIADGVTEGYWTTTAGPNNSLLYEPGFEN